jgi:hypothetical protein
MRCRWLSRQKSKLLEMKMAASGVRVVEVLDFVFLNDFIVTLAWFIHCWDDTYNEIYYTYNT